MMKLAPYLLFLLLTPAFIIPFAPNLSQPPSTSPDFVWPISGSRTPDLPQSSAYGPRQKASENFRYDFHQGLDLPTPISTTLIAVTTSTVKIAGYSPNYADGIVQLDLGDNLYANYIHITASLVTTGQIVGIGQPVALSGVGDSGFAHLHFELRQGSSFRRDAINPLRYLPYTDTLSHTVAITEIARPNTVWLRAATSASELDLNVFSITVRSALDQRVLDSQVLNYEARNKQYNGDPALIDLPDLDGVLIQPERYTSSSSIYTVSVQFHNLHGAGPVLVDACAIDVHDHAVCATASGAFAYPLFLPMVQR